MSRTRVTNALKTTSPADSVDGAPRDEIRKSFHQQLDDINKLIELAAMVVESIPRATQACSTDLSAAQAVIATTIASTPSHSRSTTRLRYRLAATDGK